MSDNDQPIDALLLDLDDTLLSNDMERFIPSYFSLLSEYASPLFEDRDRLLVELMYGTQAMMNDTDPSRSNREVFWALFLERTGLDAEETEAFFDRFYEERFPRLRQVTEPRPVAVELVEYALGEGIQVVIATNPLFPRRAIEHRLEWAGLPVDTYEFALITSYDNMHASKPNEAYYRQILDEVGAEAAKSVMVGDNWENDIAPASALGMRSYWIAPASAPPPQDGLIAGQGSLDDFYQWLREQRLQGQRRGQPEKSS